ncbi:MAG: Ig-like domain-containing protein [Prevotella sp.]|nr:Ig-like domain-containing protein [Prevotella sp.]MBQ8487978.1 Ig-like domain-containing protein [Prevotella sp.]
MKRLFTALTLLLFVGLGKSFALETYDFQELCMKIGKGGPWAVNDGDDAGFTVNEKEMHLLGDYTEQGFEWNGRFAYEFVDGRGKFTMRNKSNKKDTNCGMFSWDYAHYFSILNLKKDDKITITVGTGTVTFVSENLEGVSAGDAVGKDAYVVTEDGHVDILMAEASLISKILIEPAGVETVPTIALNKSEVKLIPGATFTLKATVDPADKASETQWKSSDESVATVDAKGVVTAVAAGTATITNLWESGISDATSSASCDITVADVDLSALSVVTSYDFTTLGDVTLELEEEAAGEIWNDANAKNNDVFFCTNAGLEFLAVQAAVSGNKGWSVVDGEGLFLATGAGRCAAINGLKEGQIVEVFYTGDGFYTKNDGSDDGVKKTALCEGAGRVFFQIDADGMMGFELVKGNAVTKINIYEKDSSVLMGDVNGDDVVNVTDVTLTIDYVLGKNPVDFNEKAADMDGTEKIDITDVTLIIDAVLNK